MVDDTRTATVEYPGGKLCESYVWSSHKVKGEVSPGITLVVNKVKQEGFNPYLQILSQGEDAIPMISELVRA